MPNGDEYIKQSGKAPSLGSIDIKLAVLCERLANSQKIQTSINTKMEKHIDQSDRRIRDIEICSESTITKAADNKDEIDRLRNKSNIIDILIAIGSIILGALGINIK